MNNCLINKKIIKFFIMTIMPSLNFSMHQLARPAVIQMSAVTAIINPCPINSLRNRTTSTAKFKSVSKIKTLTNQTAKLDQKDLEKLLQRLLNGQKKQRKLLKQVLEKVDSIQNEIDCKKFYEVYETYLTKYY